VFTSQPSMLANCLLVLSLWQSFDYEQVKELDLLVVRLVVKLVAGAFFQLRLLSTGTILSLETGKSVWAGWIV